MRLCSGHWSSEILDRRLLHQHCIYSSGWLVYFFVNFPRVKFWHNMLCFSIVTSRSRNATKCDTISTLSCPLAVSVSRIEWLTLKVTTLDTGHSMRHYSWSEEILGLFKKNSIFQRYQAMVLYFQVDIVYIIEYV